MTVNQMKRVLAGCRQGKTMLLISEKSRMARGKRFTYAAVFDSFVEKPDEKYTDGPVPPNWLYVDAGSDNHRCMILRDVAEIAIIPSLKQQALVSICKSILGKKMPTAKMGAEPRKITMLAAQLLNGFLGVNPESNF